MRTRLTGFIILLLAAGCVIDGPYEDKIIPLDDHAVMLQSSQYVSHTASQLSFEASVIVLNSFYEGFDNDYLGVTDFKISGSAGSYTIESFKGEYLQNSAGPSSIVFVMDQSSSYEDVDPFNTRAQAVNKFFQDITHPNTFVAGASARQGSMATEPLELAAPVFGNDWEGQAAYLFALARRTGGQNAMVDACDKALDFISATAATGRKELVMLVHRSDDTSVAPLHEVIMKAQATGVRTHVIALGSGYDADNFLRLSQETGWLFAPCDTDKRMVKVFSELERLINGELFVYRIRVNFTPSQNLLESGSTSLHKVEITDPYSDNDYNTLTFKITVP